MRGNTLERVHVAATPAAAAGVYVPFRCNCCCVQAAVLLRIDDVLSGVRKEGKGGGAQVGEGVQEDMETFGDARDG